MLVFTPISSVFHIWGRENTLVCLALKRLPIVLHGKELYGLWLLVKEDFCSLIHSPGLDRTPRSHADLLIYLCGDDMYACRSRCTSRHHTGSRIEGLDQESGEYDSIRSDDILHWKPDRRYTWKSTRSILLVGMWSNVRNSSSLQRVTLT